MGNEQSNQNGPVCHALPLIRIINNKMDIVAAVPKIDLSKTKVVSILGKARMGKSTFLNAIISKICGENKNIFETKDDLDHCTRGIDYYYLAKENILLLDSQGLAHEDSRHDPALLLFVYLVSDVIVFNERMMLQNEALSLLQPICTFMNYVDLEDIQKPRLIFRISDGDMVKDTNKNLEKLLTSYPDQYQSIRESIGILFEKGIHVVRTNTLDRVARNFLEGNDYKSLLEHSSMGFQDAIDQILQAARASPLQKNPYFKNIKEIVDKINNNEKIKVEKLDIVGLTARNEIQDWILAMDTAIYSPMEVDGTQKMHEEKVEVRKNQKKQLLKSFTMRFKTFPLTIREPYYADLQKKMEEPIRIATEQSIRLAKHRVSEFYKKASTAKTIKLHSTMRSFSSIEESSIASYFPELVTLTSAIEDIYEPVKREYETMIKKVYKSFKESIDLIKQEETKESTFVKTTCDQAIQSFPGWIRSEIDTLEKINETPLIQFTNMGVFALLLKKKKQDLSFTLVQGIVKRSLVFSVKDMEPSYEIIDLKAPLFVGGLYDVTIKYHLIQEIYKEFETYVEEFQTFNTDESKSILERLVARKAKKLDGYLFPNNNTSTNSIVAKNEDCIEFMRFNTSILSNIFNTDIMTRNTYNTFYKPLMDQAFQACVKSGYAKTTNDAKLIYTIQPTKAHTNFVITQYELVLNASDAYRRCLLDVFIHKLKKAYCKAVMKEWTPPKVWQEKIENDYVLVPEPTQKTAVPVPTNNTSQEFPIFPPGFPDQLRHV